MGLFSRPARGELARYIDCLWWFDGGGREYARERALPTGTAELVFALSDEPVRVFRDDGDQHGERFAGSLVLGPQTGYFVLDTSRRIPVVGVHFRPGGAAPFLDAPAGEFTDRALGLEDVWGGQARETGEQLREAGSVEEQFRIVEGVLLERLRRRLDPHPAVMHALRVFGVSPDVARVAAVRVEAGYGAKRFIQLFRDGVGLAPKRFCRIARFQQVIERLARGGRVEWARVAADSGYYDQPHLNREFRLFAGVPPGDYRPVAGRINHVAI